jgi:hypothetical protein
MYTVWFLHTFLLPVSFVLQHDVDATLRMAEETLEVELTWSLEPVVNRDWVDQIKASYTPQQVCPGLWIIPTWSEVVEQDAVNIILEPGVAFGTGECRGDAGGFDSFDSVGGSRGSQGGRGACLALVGGAMLTAPTLVTGLFVVAGVVPHTS